MKLANNIPTRCLPLHWLHGTVAQAGNRLTADLALMLVSADTQWQLEV